MAKLCIYIPPFASDYTGVCSALFDLDCLTAIVDASCCTEHYVYYDEPRWAEKARPTFSTQLRTIDAILGNDEKIVECVIQAASSVNTQIIALVGTPVPGITGMDLRGMAWEIEDRSGKTTLGFSTTGFEYYDKGIAEAGKALIQRYTKKNKIKHKHSVNILGITPLDYGDVGNDSDIRAAFEKEGWKVNACMFMGMSINEIEQLLEAEINIAVSSSGVTCAKYLKERFGMPYVAIAPMGNELFSAFLDRLSKQDDRKITIQTSGSEDVLIIMDQVMGNSLRNAMYLAGCKHKINIASFFGWNNDLAEKGDFFIPTEKNLIMTIRSGKYRYVIGDPFLAHIPDMSLVKYFEVVHPAVSGKLQWENTPQYLSDSFDKYIQNIVEEIV